jgi:hypothetical protein
MMSLTDEQLTQVQQAAALLAPYERDFFLKSVANYLRDRHPSNEEVAAACTFVLGKEADAAQPTSAGKPKSGHRRPTSRLKSNSVQCDIAERKGPE